MSNMDNSYDARIKRRRIVLNNDMSASFSATCSPTPRTALEVQRGIVSYVDELAAARMTLLRVGGAIDSP